MKALKIKTIYLLILIAIVAFVLGGLTMRTRSKAFDLKAKYHASQERFHHQRAQQTLEVVQRVKKRIQSRAATLAELNREAIKTDNMANLEKDPQTSKRLRALARSDAAIAQMQANRFKIQNEIDNIDIISFNNIFNKENNLIKYHSNLYKKYKYASDHPWIFVPPDPPEPIN